MQPHPNPAQRRRRAAQTPADPTIIARQIFAEARPYNAYPSCAAPLSSETLPLPGEAFTGCVGSIAPIQHFPYSIDALGRPIPPTTPRISSSSPNHSLFHYVRHENVPPSQLGPINPSPAVQLRTRRLLQNASTRENSQQDTGPKNPMSSIRDPQRTTSQGNEARSYSHCLEACNAQPPGNLGSPCSFSPPTRSAKSQAHTRLARNPAPTSRGPESQSDSASTNDREYLWLEHGQKDPTVRSLQARSPEDCNRRDAMRQKGGSCAPCRRSKKQCDDHDYCQSCIRKKFLSEAKMLALMESNTYIPGFEDVSLRDLDPSTLLNNRSPAEVARAAMTAAQVQAINHVNDWFKWVSRNIDPKPFYDAMFQGEVSLGITSGPDGKTESCFNLEYVHISNHFEIATYPLDDKILEAAFLQHSSAQMPDTPRHDAPRSQCASRLSSAVSHTFAFLKSFADANLYAHINHIAAARATVSIVYANLYRLLLSKSDAFCSFVSRAFQHDFQYCARASRDNLLEDALRGLAQYYSVLTALAKLELQSSSEVAALFSKLEQRAKGLLEKGGIRRLFLDIYTKLRDSTHARGGVPQPEFEELLRDYVSDVPPIKSLSIALRVNSGNGDIAPVPTEAFRDTDPYNHNIHIKVRDLLKRSEESVMDPKQLYIDGIVENFDFLGHTLPDEPDISASWLGDLQELLSNRNPSVADTPSESMDPEHGSLRPSQDNDTLSVKSESTIQDHIQFDHPHLTDALVGGDQEDHDWQQVQSRKRRQRSDDSQNSQQSSGRGERKHIKLEAGRESPPPYQHNYFDVLTGEPATLG
ncbi:hypothetical protein EPUS_03416 [Endocarpon pusillum Z07020]|uniref:Uncharacterized protein n=1 Tax=Endocarpon pusillum (strain Z07020 / HMAS-L-300199) TaxID=1263415 RepID=U1GQI8_ENDPU|nr:uncharacterized protein EPUS_03416 [Endocarpon pusillum Z07020]ERF74226.1 hypothetical protein EPUS_03416 [Endocarpon pusillum Z07020]